MLKVEKCARSSHITLILREREPFFNSVLIKALACALFLHLGALTLFQIQSFNILSSFLFPPIQVQINTINPLSHPITLVRANSLEIDEPLAPSLLTGIPSPSLLHDPFLSEPLLAGTIPIPFPFASLEQRYWPVAVQNSLPAIIEKPPVEMVVSGDLALFPLIEEDPILKTKIILKSPEQDPLLVTYSVRLDEKEGSLFWFERTGSSGSVEVDALTERILMNLRFGISTPSIPSTAISRFISGRVHFTVYRQQDD